jgi:hypothetical protein
MIVLKNEKNFRATIFFFASRFVAIAHNITILLLRCVNCFSICAEAHTIFPSVILSPTSHASKEEKEGCEEEGCQEDNEEEGSKKDDEEKAQIVVSLHPSKKALSMRAFFCA